jgi:hypothetical protein
MQATGKLCSDHASRRSWRKRNRPNLGHFSCMPQKGITTSLALGTLMGRNESVNSAENRSCTLNA